MTGRRLLHFPALVAAVVGGFRTTALAQCAMCNASADASRAGGAFSLSVLFLLAVLFALIGWLAVLAARSSSGR